MRRLALGDRNKSADGLAFASAVERFTGVMGGARMTERERDCDSCCFEAESGADRLAPANFCGVAGGCLLGTDDALPADVLPAPAPDAGLAGDAAADV